MTNKKRGFTLIELLVVIAIIALLLSILMPSLQTVKKIAQGVVCSTNAKALSMGATLFAQANNDLIPNSVPSNIDDTNRQSITKKGWVTRPHNLGKITISPMSDATPDDRIRGVEGGTLYPYIGDPKVYHCPGDRRFKDTYKNYLSYSIPSCIRPDSPDRKHYVNKLGQITLPSTKYIFLEESDPREYYRGPWSFGTKEQVDSSGNDDGWWDGLAIWHNNASVFGFADGHTESHKWRDDYTRTRAGWTLQDLKDRNGGGNPRYGYIAWPNAEYGGVRNDLNWMQDAWPYSR